ncbi:acetyltransferase [Spirulina sp. CCNP1310]|uniref:acetyltransferase n=1 Tax=Spirulina sp. CCNP1310 TaxID=3110249 RepID=UPI002B1F12C6|nr:acetyltransferase [Spirulina sp. CCNP1310]MEA5421205.1 acetyltransferase [Spirulina sp. CCNP1310]
MFEKIYILGAGGHGKVVLETLLMSGIQPTGILDNKLYKLGKIRDIPILGGDDYLNSISSNCTYLINGLGANPQTTKRRNLFETMKARGFTFKSLSHPSSVISCTVEFGEGCQVMAGAILQPDVILGDNVVINTRSSIDHDCVIESHVFISPGVVLCGNVKVSSCAFIGAGAVIMPGIRIGNGSVIGAGSVVTEAIPDEWVVLGNPAKRLR